MNPYVFIVGCPRSGTTLLQRMVDAHPAIAITPETHWIPRFFRRRTGLTPEGLVTAELIASLFEYERFTRLNLGREIIESLVASECPISYATFVSNVFDLYGKAQGKRLVGDKTPGYVQDISLLHDLWPHAKFVHLIRDGRDIYLSMKSWSRGERTLGRFSTWNEDPVTTTAAFWKHRVQVGREQGRVLGPELYYELRYESLVAEPKQECAALCEFLKIRYNNAMLSFHEGQTRAEPGLSSKDSWLPVTVGLRNWRKEMPAPDIERFEAAAGDLLVELGYERMFANLSGENLEHAQRIQSVFSLAMQRRGLPQRRKLP